MKKRKKESKRLDINNKKAPKKQLIDFSQF